MTARDIEYAIKSYLLNPLRLWTGAMPAITTTSENESNINDMNDLRILVSQESIQRERTFTSVFSWKQFQVVLDFGFEKMDVTDGQIQGHRIPLLNFVNDIGKFFYQQTTQDFSDLPVAQLARARYNEVSQKWHVEPVDNIEDDNVNYYYRKDNEFRIFNIEGDVKTYRDDYSLTVVEHFSDGTPKPKKLSDSDLEGSTAVFYGYLLKEESSGAEWFLYRTTQDAEYNNYLINFDSGQVIRDLEIKEDGSGTEVGGAYAEGTIPSSVGLAVGQKQPKSKFIFDVARLFNEQRVEMDGAVFVFIDDDDAGIEIRNDLNITINDYEPIKKSFVHKRTIPESGLVPGTPAHHTQATKYLLSCTLPSGLVPKNRPDGPTYDDFDWENSRYTASSTTNFITPRAVTDPGFRSQGLYKAFAFSGRMLDYLSPVSYAFGNILDSYKVANNGNRVTLSAPLIGDREYYVYIQKSVGNPDPEPERFVVREVEA